MAKEIQLKTKRLILTPTPLVELERKVLLMGTDAVHSIHLCYSADIFGYAYTSKV